MRGRNLLLSMDRFEERLLTGALGGLAVGWGAYAATRLGFNPDMDLQTLHMGIKTFERRYEGHDALTSSYIGSITAAAALQSISPVRRVYRTVKALRAQMRATQEIADLKRASPELGKPTKET